MIVTRLCGGVTISHQDRVGSHNSFEVNRMMVRTGQLLRIKEVTHMKVYLNEHEAEAHERKKTWCSC